MKEAWFGEENNSLLIGSVCITYLSRESNVLDNIWNKNICTLMKVVDKIISSSDNDSNHLTVPLLYVPHYLGVKLLCLHKVFKYKMFWIVTFLLFVRLWRRNYKNSGKKLILDLHLDTLPGNLHLECHFLHSKVQLNRWDKAIKCLFRGHSCCDRY